MKLIYCKLCSDIVGMNPNEDSPRVCSCGESSGIYTDNKTLSICGPAIPIGIDNTTFRRAVFGRPKTGKGKTFVAFVIPHDNSHIILGDEQ
jgi:hypothetical protein